MGLVGCDDDWDNYEEKNENVSIKMENNIFNLDECIDELKCICSKYADNLSLVHAEYYFLENEDNYAVISLYRDYYKNNEGYTILCNVYVNTENNEITKVSYINGNSKRVSLYSRELEDVAGIYANELYDDIHEKLESDTLKTLGKCEISYYYDKININCYDKNEKNIYRTIVEP